MVKAHYSNELLSGDRSSLMGLIVMPSNSLSAAVDAEGKESPAQAIVSQASEVIIGSSIETGLFELEISNDTSRTFLLSARSQSSVASSEEAASLESSMFSRASSLGLLSSLSMGSWHANVLHSCCENQGGNYIGAAGGTSNAAADVLSRAGSYSCIATMRCKGDEEVLPCVALAGTRHCRRHGNCDDHLDDLKCRVRRRVCSEDDDDRENFSWLDCASMLQAGGRAGIRAVVRVGERIVSAHADHKIRVWSNGGSSSCKLVATLPTLRHSLMASLLASNYVQVRRHRRRLWMEHVDTISALAVSVRPDGAGVLYSGSWDRTVKVWRLSDFKCVESFQAHDDAVNAMVVSADGSFLYTGSADGKVGVWEAAGLSSSSSLSTSEHSHVTTLDGHKSAVNALALSPDGNLLYSGACDKAIIVWQRSGEQAARHLSCPAGALRGHRRAILCLASVTAAAGGLVDGSIHNRILCSGSADRTIRVWQRVPVTADVRPNPSAPHVCMAVLHGHAGPVKCLTVVPPASSSSDSSASLTMDSLTVYSGSLDRHIKVWSVSLL